MNPINKLLFGVIGGIALASVAISGAAAHENDDFAFFGTANETCLHPDATHWTVTWTIENFEGSNPFGIVDTDPDVGFAPLVDDAAPGAYVPAGESATAISLHPVSEASASLTVTHDVTFGDDIDFTAGPVDRPPLCDPFDPDGFLSDLDIKITNTLNNINENINVNTNTNTNTNVNRNTQNQTNNQNVNVSTGDVNVSSTGGSGIGTSTGR